MLHSIVRGGAEHIKPLPISRLSFTTYHPLLSTGRYIMII
jgi:hypothetical protein